MKRFTALFLALACASVHGQFIANQNALSVLTETGGTNFAYVTSANALKVIDTNVTASIAAGTNSWILGGPGTNVSATLAGGPGTNVTALLTPGSWTNVTAILTPGDWTNVNATIIGGSAVTLTNIYGAVTNLKADLSAMAPALTNIDVGTTNLLNTAIGGTNLLAAATNLLTIANGLSSDGTNLLAATTNQLEAVRAAVVATTNFTSIASTGTLASTTAYKSNLVVKASAGVLIAVWGFSSKAGSQYIHLYDSATLPAEGTAPSIAPIIVPATSNFYLDVPNGGIPFANGIVVGNSSTAATKTGGAEDTWFSAIYR